MTGAVWATSKPVSVIPAGMLLRSIPVTALPKASVPTPLTEPGVVATARADCWLAFNVPAVKSAAVSDTGAASEPMPWSMISVTSRPTTLGVALPTTPEDGWRAAASMALTSWPMRQTEFCVRLAVSAGSAWNVNAGLGVTKSAWVFQPFPKARVKAAAVSRYLPFTKSCTCVSVGGPASPSAACARGLIERDRACIERIDAGVVDEGLDLGVGRSWYRARAPAWPADGNDRNRPDRVCRPTR